jgi:FAD/FMN-containing dehydrogenase/Fe-S oxidoreductase
MKIDHKLNALQKKLSGELFYDDLHLNIYATDASVYRMIPKAVAYPKNEADIKQLIAYATENNTTLIPRAAGTSLAGQVVGKGIIVDISKYFTKIIEFNQKEQWVRVQPGVIRDELNRFLADYGLWFAPNTSTSSRCMLGGMVGNNSSGSTSIRYGVTRDKVLSIKGLLSSGDNIELSNLSKKDFDKKVQQDNFEGKIYRYLRDTFIDKAVQKEIRENMPYPEIHRRNNGYTLDTLIDNEVFSDNDKAFNLGKLIAGSEGTLLFMTEITLYLDKIQPEQRLMVAAHFDSIDQSMRAVAPAMEYNLYQCELMDDIILDVTKESPKYYPYRSFLQGNPKAILMLELRGADMQVLEKQADALIDTLKQQNLGYAFPILKAEEASKAEELRKAGLGLLGNLPGDDKAIAGIEDTAVRIKDLPDYIEDFSKIMLQKDKRPVYFAHAGAGEIHLRPILNLKKSVDVRIYRELVSEVADLVHSYKGSMSGEHGSGIVRAEYIPTIVGKKNYTLMQELKTLFDPQNIFNAHKIVDPFPMDKNLRYEPDRKEPEIPTLFDFTREGGVLRAAEKCNGSGDCRKPPEAGGVMCPSYQATLDEKNTTRARANALREFLTHSDKINKFDYDELYETLSLCLSCKACKSECPSTVDMAMLKSEFLYQYQKANGFSLRSKMFAYSGKVNALFSHMPSLYNFFIGQKWFAKIFKKWSGIAKERALPKLEKQSLSQWIDKHPNELKAKQNKKQSVYVFIDEFIDYMDAQPGKDVIFVLTSLGYEVKTIKSAESGRAYISKGFLEQAQALAVKNVNLYKNLIDANTPLIGIEPSAILMFRDEYLKLIKDKNLKKQAEKIAENTYVFEDFIKKEFDNKNISTSDFTEAEKKITLHVHCHQKALSNQEDSAFVLSIPKNYTVELLDTGCCGMAGSFGYEKEHYDLSMKVGELRLFPALRQTDKDTAVVASGTSCRHQIHDGVDKDSEHPASILRKALR